MFVGHALLAFALTATAARVLGWSPERIQEEVRRTADLLVTRHGVQLKQAAVS